MHVHVLVLHQAEQSLGAAVAEGPHDALYQLKSSLVTCRLYNFDNSTANYVIIDNNDG